MARLAARAAPTGRTRRGTTARAPSPGLAPRRAARRRTRHRIDARSSASSSVTVCSRLRDPPAHVLVDASGVDRLLYRGDDQPVAGLRQAAIPVLDHLREVVPRVDMHDRERQRQRAERLLGDAQQHDRVLAAAEQQHRPLSSATTSRITNTASASSARSCETRRGGRGHATAGSRSATVALGPGRRAARRAGGESRGTATVESGSPSARSTAAVGGLGRRVELVVGHLGRDPRSCAANQSRQACVVGLQLRDEVVDAVEVVGRRMRSSCVVLRAPATGSAPRATATRPGRPCRAG